MQTVKALLSTAALQRLDPEPLRFCATPACEIVYFGEHQRYEVADVRVPVWQKLAAGARMICYCFGENESDISREIAETGATAAAARVRAHIAAKRCACELRNPRGSCCLGDLMTIVNRLQAERLAMGWR